MTQQTTIKYIVQMMSRQWNISSASRLRIGSQLKVSTVSIPLTPPAGCFPVSVTVNLLPISSNIFPRTTTRRVDCWSCSHVPYQLPPPAVPSPLFLGYTVVLHGVGGRKCDWQHSIAHPRKSSYGCKNLADISYTDRVLSQILFHGNGCQSEKMQFAAFNGPSPKTPP